MRFSVDRGVERHPGVDYRPVLLGGQPLRLIRLTTRSEKLFDALADGATLADAARATRVTHGKADQFARRLLDASVLHPIPPALPMPDMTVVIPVRDRAESLDRLLRCLPSVAHVVVVDDGSTDNSGEVARHHGADVIRHLHARGPAAARNAGAAAATTEFVAFIDSDCVPSADWLATSLAHFADPDVLAVAPRIVALGPTDTALRAYEDVRSALDLGPLPGPVIPKTRIAYVPSAALVVQREAFAKIHGFDEVLHVGEDVDFMWRLQKYGTIRYEPEATVAHDHRHSLPAFARRRAQYGTSAAALARRHPGQVPPLVISPWTATAWIVALTQTVPGIAIAAAVVEGTARQLPAKLNTVKDAKSLGLRLGRHGHLGAGRHLASAAIRTYLPLLGAAAIVSKRARRALVAAAVIPNVLEWRERRPKLDPARFTALRIVDDASYCFGVWLGCIRERTVAPLRPQFVNWPGRRKVSEDS